MEEIIDFIMALVTVIALVAGALFVISGSLFIAAVCFTLAKDVILNGL